MHLIALLPCYLPTSVDEQRGSHVYRESIEAIQRLNRAGYGRDADTLLDLVYNPLGASLPPVERTLEATYRDVMAKEHGIRFIRLIAITNIAAGRFLEAAFGVQPADSRRPDAATSSRRARRLLVRLRFPLRPALPVQGPRRNVRDLGPALFARRRLVTGPHCSACTGHGSCCGGALVRSRYGPRVSGR